MYVNSPNTDRLPDIVELPFITNPCSSLALRLRVVVLVESAMYSVNRPAQNDTF